MNFSSISILWKRSIQAVLLIWTVELFNNSIEFVCFDKILIHFKIIESNLIKIVYHKLLKYFYLIILEK